MSATTATTREEVLNTVFEFVDKTNEGDLQAAADMHSPDCITYFPGMPPMNQEVWKPFFLSYFAAFPDLRVNTRREDAIIEGDLMAGRYTLTGTHRGDFMGIPATGKRINIFGINIFRVRDGKVVEEWDMNDGLSMFQQLGLIPAPGANPAS